MAREGGPLSKTLPHRQSKTPQGTKQGQIHVIQFDHKNTLPHYGSTQFIICHHFVFQPSKKELTSIYRRPASPPSPPARLTVPAWKPQGGAATAACGCPLVGVRSCPGYHHLGGGIKAPDRGREEVLVWLIGASLGLCLRQCAFGDNC